MNDPFPSRLKEICWRGLIELINGNYKIEQK